MQPPIAGIGPIPFLLTSYHFSSTTLLVRASSKRPGASPVFVSHLTPGRRLQTPACYFCYCGLPADMGKSNWNCARAPNPLVCAVSRRRWRTSPTPHRQTEPYSRSWVGSVMTSLRRDPTGGAPSHSTNTPLFPILRVIPPPSRHDPSAVFQCIETAPAIG